jgi:hypothetical protein
MVGIVKIRACVFIPEAWFLADSGVTTGIKIEYEGDDRGFTPHTSNTLRFRVEQEATIDFRKRELHSHKATGISRERVRHPDDSVKVRTGRAVVDGITCGVIEWKEGLIEFEMRASARNPLIVNADTVDYSLRVSVRQTDGQVTVRGSHDGFPCYEFYKQVDYGDFQTIYTHDYRLTGDTIAALAGPMEYTFDRTV